MNTKQLIIKLGMALVTFSSMNLYAKDVFTSEIQVDNQSQVLGYSSISDVADQYDSYNMKAMFPTYTETSFVNAKVNLRDVPVNLSYAQNSSTLTFKIPSLGIERTYTGATREESKDMFLDALKGEDKELFSVHDKNR